MDDVFTFIGQAVGEFIRFLVDALVAFFSGLDEAVAGFVQGVAGALGIAPSLVGLLVLAFGLWALWRGFRALRRGAFVVTLIWALLGATVLSWLIY
ncbi:hypothetical protein [Halomonas koreensis]|uniref:MFS transporter n=1 Tax=Halomonas koreensis TaxID=245385 RepID=A0ABU1G538_9GAMM|nr:hypothetical protein [Halomonas koreensis]MDR5868025.1 hypothetical protein [Halomonas koreensis]